MLSVLKCVHARSTPRVSQEQFWDPVTCSGQECDSPLRVGSASRLWVKRSAGTQAHAQGIWCWQTGSRHTRYQSKSIKRQLWKFIRIQTILTTWRMKTRVSKNIHWCTFLKTYGTKKVVFSTYYVAFFLGNEYCDGNLMHAKKCILLRLQYILVRVLSIMRHSWTN